MAETATAIVSLFTSCTALWATARLICKAFLVIEILLGSGEYEVYAALAAC